LTFKENQSIVPYSAAETDCFMCKEKLQVERDAGLQVGTNSNTEHIFANKTSAQGAAG
jgi:hypothetical protein